MECLSLFPQVQAWTKSIFPANRFLVFSEKQREAEPTGFGNSFGRLQPEEEPQKFRSHRPSWYPGKPTLEKGTGSYPCRDNTMDKIPRKTWHLSGQAASYPFLKPHTSLLYYISEGVLLLLCLSACFLVHASVGKSDDFAWVYIGLFRFGCNHFSPPLRHYYHLDSPGSLSTSLCEISHLHCLRHEQPFLKFGVIAVMG